LGFTTARRVAIDKYSGQNRDYHWNQEAAEKYPVMAGKFAGSPEK
jgi:hypothetical protein